jgi:hypothetical protein
MVIGILSITDESIAVAQSTIRAVRRIFFSTPPEISCARYSKTQADSIPHTRTNKDTKNKNTESSSFLRYFCGLSCGATRRSIDAAHKSATTDAGIWNRWCVKNSTITTHNTMRLFLSIRGLIIDFCSFILMSLSIYFGLILLSP